MQNNTPTSLPVNYEHTGTMIASIENNWHQQTIFLVCLQSQFLKPSINPMWVYTTQQIKVEYETI